MALPTYDYSYYGHPASWTKIGCVSLPVKAVSGAVNSSTTNPIPAGNYVSGDFEIILENSALADFKSIFESFNPSGAIPDPVWILDAASYSTQTAGFWNWYDNGSGDGGFFPTTMMGNMSGYSLGARIPGAKPGRIDWKWDHGGIKLTLKGNIQVDEDIPYTGWNLEMCLLKFNAFTGPYPPDTTQPEIVSIIPATGTNLTAYEGKDVQVNSSLAIKFSEDVTIASNAFYFSKEVDRGTVYSNQSLSIPFTISYDSSTYTATFTPNSPLDPGVKYLLAHYTSTRTKDSAGNSLRSNQFTNGYEFTTLAASSPPEIVNIHFYYNPGSVIDKQGNLDDVSATYQAPLESAAAIFLLEFDKPIDASAITSAPTKPIGIMDLTELGSTGHGNYIISVGSAGYGVEWWKYYDDVHNLTSSTVGGFTSSTPLKDGPLNPNLTSSSPMENCIYVAIPGGVLKAGHEYGIWHIPELIKDTNSIPMTRYNTGSAFTATWDAGPSLTSLLLKIEAPASSPPVLKGFHVAYPSDPSLSGRTKSLPLNVDITTPYQVPVDNTHSPCFYLEYDQALDNHAPANKSRIQLREEGGSVVLGLIDVTQVNAAIADGGWVGGLSGYLNSPYPYLTQDGVYSLRGTTKVTSDTLSNETGGVVTPFNSTLSHHCVYFQVDPGQLKEGHIYNLFRRPNEIDNIAGDLEDSSWSSNDPAAKFGILWKTEADTSAPTIVSFTPANGATGVSVNASITVTFSEEVILPVGQNVTYASVNQAGNWISQPATVSYSSKTVTITPTNPLPGTSIINVAVPTGVTDSAGNALALQSWSFMTAAPPDTRVPIEAYAIGFTKDPDNFKSIPLTKSGTITQEFKIPAVDIDGPKIMYLRLRDQDGLISTNYRIALRVLDFELETFEVDTHGYCGGTTNQIDVLFDTDTDPTTMEYGYLIDDSGEPTVWNPVTPLSYDDVGKYKLNFNLDVSTISSGQHDLYVWLRTLEGEKKFCKTDFVSEPIPADPYGILTVKKSMIDGNKKKVWVEANVFDAGVGVSAISFVESTNPASFESINIIQNKRITKLFEYDASANTTNTFNLIIEDAVGRTSALITTSIDLSGVY